MMGLLLLILVRICQKLPRSTLQKGWLGSTRTRAIRRSVHFHACLFIPPFRLGSIIELPGVNNWQLTLIIFQRHLYQKVYGIRDTASSTLYSILCTAGAHADPLDELSNVIRKRKKLYSIFMLGNETSKRKLISDLLQPLIIKNSQVTKIKYVLAFQFVLFIMGVRMVNLVKTQSVYLTYYSNKAITS